MNINIVANKAGNGATIIVQNGFPPKGLITHPRVGIVGSNRSGTCSFGVLNPIHMSTMLMLKMAMITAKSLITIRTYSDELKILVCIAPNLYAHICTYVKQ